MRVLLRFDFIARRERYVLFEDGTPMIQLFADKAMKKEIVQRHITNMKLNHAQFLNLCSAMLNPSALIAEIEEKLMNGSLDEKRKIAYTILEAARKAFSHSVDILKKEQDEDDEDDINVC